MLVSETSKSCNVFAGGGSCHSDDNCWLIRAVVAEGPSDCINFLK